MGILTKEIWLIGIPVVLPVFFVIFMKVRKKGIDAFWPYVLALIASAIWPISMGVMTAGGILLLVGEGLTRAYYKLFPNEVPRSGWLKRVDRGPRWADSDDWGEVYVVTASGQVIRTFWRDAQRGLCAGWYTHWKPTGNKRPQPPTEDSDDE